MINLILDQCLERVRAGQASVAECLARYPDFALELAPLLDMALAIEALPEVKPSTDFRRTVRSFLLHLPLQIAASSRNSGLMLDPNRQTRQAN